MKIKTASDLKYMHEYHQPDSYYFDRKSMRFFGDTMRNYACNGKPLLVERSSGNSVECYELRRVHPVKHGLQNSAYFAVDDLRKIISKGE